MTKSDLRKIYLEKRRSLSPNEHYGLSRKVTDSFISEFDLSRVKLLHCFISLKRSNEIDTSLIFERIWSKFPGIQTLAPRVNYHSNDLESVKFGSETKFIENKWNILEPATGEIVKPEQIDMVLVPGLCFDHHGHRVGYGKGFYDRFLVKCRPDCIKIGLGFFEPVDEITDVHEGDRPLDYCVTPERFFTTKTQRRGD
ncbi:MAG: 5-formyltetrahydrofolate cyclo-ligase [Blastocatellia bacterium]